MTDATGLCDHLTAGSFCAPCVAEAHQAATRVITESQEDPGLKALEAEFASSGDDTGDDEVDQAEAEKDSTASPEEVPPVVRYAGILGYENQYTGDGRFIAPGALRADPETLPLPLRYAPQDMGGHDGAYVVGLIESMTTTETGAILGEGFIDTTTPQGLAVYHGMQNGTIGGVSMDLDDLEYEAFARGDGAPIEDDAYADDESPDGYSKVAEGSSDDVVLHINSARVRGATLVAIPAFATARIALVASIESDNIDLMAAQTITAAAPIFPPSAWFASPDLREPTPLTFTTDGRVYGHIALWGTCHTGIPGACVTPPYSATNYAYFRTGVLLTDEGTEVPVGHLTMDTGHAGPNMSASAALAHYDNTGTVAADVAAGEDTFGIWVNGAIRPDLTDEEIRDLRSAPMSGDWRRIGGNLELMAVLAVNLPGFPVLRTKALVASGATQSLFVPIATEIVASGTNEAEKEPTKPKYPALAAFQRQVEALQRAQWEKEMGLTEPDPEPPLPNLTQILALIDSLKKD